MEVSLVRITDDPMFTIDLAASNCYDSKPGNGELALQCYKSGHQSVLEFCQVHFHIEGVSRTLLAQLTRHRIASYAVRSQRYVNESGFDFVIPKSIEKDEFSSTLFKATMEKIRKAYASLLDVGVPAEDARFLLPNACVTTIDMSMNLRSLIHFMNERLCLRAQWEIRELALAMRKEVLRVCPELECMLVPKCEVNEDYPFCTERKSCGRHKKLSELYSNDNQPEVMDGE